MKILQSSSRGFSLLEMLLVIVVIGIASGAVGYGMSRQLNSVKIKNVSRDLVAALRYTRGQAIVKQEEKILILDVQNRSYQADGKAEIQLPKEIDLKLLTAAREQLEEGKGAVRFFPDGSSSGGRITINRGARTWRIEIAWLTGEVALREEDR